MSNLKHTALLVLGLQVALTFSEVAQAQSSPRSQIKKEEADLPKIPSAPPLLNPKTPENTEACERKILYRGKTLTCDSRLYRDGEGLRPIVRDVPQALDELNSYQNTRRRVNLLAYSGSTGLAMVIASLFMGNRPALRNILFFGGAGITLTSTFYGLSILRENEEHLSNAVKAYNSMRPDDPIELQFTTGFSF